MSQRISWAIDPFAQTPGLNKKIFSFLKAFGKGATIYPVYAPVESRIGGNASGFLFDWYEKIQKNSEKLLTKEMKKFRLTHLKPPQVLANRSLSTSGAVQAVIKHAFENEIDQIVCSTHGRKGVSRLFLGSFAENMVLAAPLPVITVGPECRPSPSIKKILFPTDFSADSKETFEQLLNVVAPKKIEIVLYHQVLDHWDMSPFGPLGGVGNPILGKELRHELMAEATGMAEKWVQLAKALNVKCAPMMKYGTRAVEDAILGALKKSGAKMIAIASQHEKLYSALLGSVTRKLIRAAPCPVWVFHPKAMEEFRRNVMDRLINLENDSGKATTAPSEMRVF